MNTPENATVREDAEGEHPSSTKIIAVGPKPSSARVLFSFITRTAFLGAVMSGIINSKPGEYVVERGLVAPLQSFVFKTGSDREGVIRDNLFWIEQGSVVGDHNKKSLRTFFPDPFTQTFIKTYKTFSLRDPDFSLKKNVLDSEGLFNFLKNQNISAREAMVVVAEFQDANSVLILGRGNDSLIKNETTRQRDASVWLKQVWGVIGQHDKSEFNKLIGEATKNDYAKASLSHLANDNDWSAVELCILQAQALLTYSRAENRDQKNPEMSLDEAKKILKDAVSETGLAALRIQRNVASDPQVLLDLAQNLLRANKVLQDQTGLSGKVLGLNNRVILSLDAFLETATTRIGQDYIPITSWWDKLPHEWFHALDRTQGEYVRQWGVLPKSNNTLSGTNDPAVREITSYGDPYRLADAQHELWKGLSDPSLTLGDRKNIQMSYQETYKKISEEDLSREAAGSTWEIQEKAAKSLVAEKSPWMHWSNQGYNKEKYSSLAGIIFPNKKASYINDRTEMLARAFGAGTKNIEHEKSLKDKTTIAFPEVEGLTENLAVYDVTEIEARAVRPVWRKYFESISSWWAYDSQKNAEMVQNKTNTQTASKKL